jgi:hypothetical protein
MIVGSTTFDHKDIHKMTWKSPDGNTLNQIDHFIIDARHLYNLMDVRTYRRANVDSDHYLVISNIRSQISNERKTLRSCIRKFYSERLKNPDMLKGFMKA